VDRRFALDTAQLLDRGAPLKLRIELAKQRKVASKVAAVGGDAARQVGARPLEQKRVVSIPVENFSRKTSEISASAGRDAVTLTRL